jgi:hypothetical protein
MTGQAFWPSLAAVAGILALATAGGWLIARAILPRGASWLLERAGWSMAIGLLLLTANVVLCLAFRLRPGWLSFALIIAVGAGLAHRFALPRMEAPSGVRLRVNPQWILLAAAAGGVVVYLLWSLEEPLASNDYFAIWGLKGKSIYGDAAIPGRLFDWPQYAFCNAAYPLGLPLLFSGISFLAGRWDDHAMALLYPFFQVATLLVLGGWLRRRGASRTVALAATSVLANFGLLYSPWLTGGMAEVPISFAFLLFGTAFADDLDGTDAGAIRRLAAASLLASGIKNEGTFLVGAALVVLFLRATRRRGRLDWRAAAALLLPAGASVLGHRIVLGRQPLRAFDFGLLRQPGLAGRFLETFREEWTDLVLPAWPALAAILLLLVLGWRRSNVLLWLSFLSLAAYLLLPAVSAYGPGWLVHWTVGRIVSSLAPLAAAGIAFCWIAPRTASPAARRSEKPLIARPAAKESGL